MNENKGMKRIHYNMQVLSQLTEFFETNPTSQYTLKSMSSTFKDYNMYHYLLQLENDDVLERSKIFINEKPVAQWQLKRNISQFPIRVSDKLYKSLPRNYSSSKNVHINQNNEACDIKQEKNDLGSLTKNFSPSTTSSVENKHKKCLPPRRLILRQESLESYQKTQVINKPISNVETNIPKSNFNSQKSKVSIKNSKSMQSSRDLNEEETLQKNNPSKEFIKSITKNIVSVLYEFAQQKGFVCQIEVIEITGPSHKPKISMAAILNGRKFDTIVSSNKKDAKILAAEAAIKTLIDEGNFSQQISKLLANGTLKNNIFKEEEIIPSKNSAPSMEKMASLVYAELTNLLTQCSGKNISISGCKVIAGLIMQDEKKDQFKVVSLGTGNRCISGDKISLQGKVVNDCHAEVVARRSLMLFFYQQLAAHLSYSEESLNIFEDQQESVTLTVLRRFKLKSHIKFHLYISTAPCGDGALFCNRDNGVKNTKSEIISSLKHEPIFEHPVQGLLRSKIEGGEGTIPVMNVKNTYQMQSLDGILRGERLKTMSCSDKIARWNYLGIQGALLSQFLEPIFLASISIGNLYNSGHLSRALCCRLDRDKSNQINAVNTVNHPYLGYVHFKELKVETEKSNELSINWSYGQMIEIVDGVTGQLIGPEKKFVCSRISKASLFHQYLKLFRNAGYNPFVNRYTYLEAKALSLDYESKKQELFSIFHKLEYGSWIRKPSEQNNFKDLLYN